MSVVKNSYFKIQEKGGEARIVAIISFLSHICYVIGKKIFYVI